MQQYLPFITQIIAIAGLVFSVWKYIDLKKTEEKRLNYENFNKILAKLEPKIIGEFHLLESTAYISSVYKLLDFPEYKYISIPILKFKKRNSFCTR